MTVSSAWCICLGFSLITIADCKQCLIDERIGQREGNIYYCNDPRLPTCCEKDYEATCCEDQVPKALTEQLILWGLIAVLISGFGVVYYCYARDTQVFESENAKVAVDKMVERFKQKRQRKTEDFSELRSKRSQNGVMDTDVTSSQDVDDDQASQDISGLKQPASAVAYCAYADAELEVEEVDGPETKHSSVQLNDVASRPDSGQIDLQRNASPSPGWAQDEVQDNNPVDRPVSAKSNAQQNGGHSRPVSAISSAQQNDGNSRPVSAINNAQQNDGHSRPVSAISNAQQNDGHSRPVSAKTNAHQNDGHSRPISAISNAQQNDANSRPISAKSNAQQNDGNSRPISAKSNAQQNDGNSRPISAKSNAHQNDGNSRPISAKSNAPQHSPLSRPVSRQSNSQRDDDSARPEFEPADLRYSNAFSRSVSGRSNAPHHASSRALSRQSNASACSVASTPPTQAET